MSPLCGTKLGAYPLLENGRHKDARRRGGNFGGSIPVHSPAPGFSCTKSPPKYVTQNELRLKKKKKVSPINERTERSGKW